MKALKARCDGFNVHILDEERSVKILEANAEIKNVSKKCDDLVKSVNDKCEKVNKILAEDDRVNKILENKVKEVKQLESAEIKRKDFPYSNDELNHIREVIKDRFKFVLEKNTSAVPWKSFKTCSACPCVLAEKSKETYIYVGSGELWRIYTGVSNTLEKYTSFGNDQTNCYMLIDNLELQSIIFEYRKKKKLEETLQNQGTNPPAQKPTLDDMCDQLQKLKERLRN